MIDSLKVAERNLSWYEEGTNAIKPCVYKEYISHLYNLEEIGIKEHPFIEELCNAMSFTPFSTEKALYAKERIKYGAQKARMEIDISDICNFKCPGCTFQFSQQDKQLSYEKLEGFIAELQRKGVEAITLAGGGEPTIYNNSGMRLPDVTEKFKEAGIEIFLITNAFALSDEDIKRILTSVSGIRISIYNFIAPGEPENKNQIVYENIHKILQIKKELNVSTHVLIGTLISWNSKKDFEFSIGLAKKFNTIVTPRPYISIQRNAKEMLSLTEVHKILDRVLKNYLIIKSEINPHQPIAMREYLERVLAFTLPLEKRCTVTELGLCGKLRANGDLYRCGQLSAKSNIIEKRKDKNIFFSNIYEGAEAALEQHLQGKKGLTNYNMCPVCRESLNNIRLNRFDKVPKVIQSEILDKVLPAYEHNKNLSKFW
ncbi:radical SAM protein [Bacillus pseudomycoides]|uniref:radical SAM protein n=1 Tax=Bacillus pseudomycoides TaxID=64104 RepID=UPI001FB22236|nr:radical SAM protein [Bacillus pseudomycoides]